MESSGLVPPELSQEESYHVFCSYINTDHEWTQSLIQQLEDRGLKVCDHERDFTPGRPILENMSESIQQSQKVLLVLSAEFLRSHWCLLEANMSMFRDCLQRKPIVPVLLQRDVSIPLHLSHLTYLDVQNPGFLQQLLRVLCTPNQELQAPAVAPSLYNGKSLLPVSAVNESQLNNTLDCGLWSNMVPDQLSLIIHQPETYREAIGLINTVHHSKVRFRSVWKLLLLGLGCATVVLSLVASAGVLLRIPHKNNALHALKIMGVVLLIAILILVMYKSLLFRRNEKLRIMRELQKAIGQANSLLFVERVLMGSESNSKLLLVYVCVDGCRRELSALSQDDDLFDKAILKYSCSYTCCLAKRHFPFKPGSNSGHLEGTVCFCEFVRHRLSTKETKRFFWWRKQHS